MKTKKPETTVRGYSILEAAASIAAISLIILITSISLRTATVNEDALAKASILTIEGLQHRSQQLNGTYVSAFDVMNDSTPLNSVTAVTTQSTSYDKVSVLVISEGVVLAAKAKKDCWVLRIISQPTSTSLAKTWFLVNDYESSGYTECSASMLLPEVSIDMDNSPSSPHIV